MENGEIISESTKNAEVLNDYFINIVKDLNIPNIATTEESVKTDPIENIIQTYANHSSICRIREHVDQIDQVSFCKINVSQMEKEINNLNPKTAPGEDGIPANIVKEAEDILKSPPTQLFNISVEDQKFPNNLKYAIVTPLFKKDDNTDKANSRPISVLHCISKIFESLMFKQIAEFVENKMTKYLCGYRKGYNTQHALMRLLDKLNKSIDKGRKTAVFMMDLSKAFDCISHDLLIANIHAYGLENQSLKLIHNYLNGRKQKVKMNSNYSTWKEIL